MPSMGIQLMPCMPVPEALDTIQAAEDLGYDFCLLADEGFMPDVYALAALAAKRTHRILLGPVTNGYTRHPAVTASSAATLNDISGGRAVVTLCAGGSMVLQPMLIAREAPLSIMQDTTRILRLLWSGERVSYRGNRYNLEQAQITLGAQNIPIWMAVRGEKLLELAGREADGVMLLAKSDLAAAFERVEQGAAGRQNPPERIYLDRIAYTPEILQDAVALYTYAVMDAPVRMLKGMGLSESEIETIQNAVKSGGPQAASQYITLDMIKAFQIAGTLDECARSLKDLVASYRLDRVVLNIISPGYEANLRLMRDTRTMVS